MGKIRVKTLGSEEFEEKEKKKRKEQKEQKKLVKIAGMKGGERVVAVGPTEEELEKLSTDNSLQTTEKTAVDGSPKTVGTSKKKAKAVKARERSKRYKAAKILVDRTRVYPLAEALELLPKLKLSKLDETVELHINTVELGISGNLTLPHGTGKKTRVAIADDKLIVEIEKGKIAFDVLVATPAMMPKLAKVAKVLGPRGLMPNPKSGTITDKPEELVKKYEGGQMRFKTEAKAPVIHLTVGKLSFGEKKLLENIKTVFSAIQTPKIKKAILKSTMSPGIKLAVNSV